MDFISLEKHIIDHPLFQKLHDIIENYPGYHDNETTFDHLLKTARIAKENIDGHFITNTKAKEKFLALVNQEIHGTKLSTIMVLTALVHDAGKILQYEENGQTKPIRVVDEHGYTPMPGHEFWGGRIVVPEILKGLDLSSTAKDMIASIVMVHGFYSDSYFPSKKDWPLEKVMSFVKSGANGYYEESLFNQYCDCYDASGFAFGKGMIEKLFNDPSFYNKRKYILP